MKKLYPYLAALTIFPLALIPPIDFALSAPVKYWPWMVLIAGFCGFYILFLKVNLFIKAISILTFINCFFSTAPYISFTAYISVVFCLYFFILCCKIEDYKPVFRVLQCLLFFNLFLMVMQIINKDALLNFGRLTECFGAVGQHMQMASFSVILTAALLPSNICNFGFPFLTSIFCNSVGGFFSASMGYIVYLIQHGNKRMIKGVCIILLTSFLAWGIFGGKFSSNISANNGRLAVWKASIKLIAEHPIKGWGIGTYQYIFPAMSGVVSIPWKSPHNCWLQLLFEGGIVIFSVLVAYFLSLIKNLIQLTRRAIFKRQAYICLAGLTMIAVNMFIHFPSRMIQTVLIIVFFLAYCENIILKGAENGEQ